MIWGVVKEGRPVTAIYLDFSKAFASDSSNSHIDKLMKYDLEIWTVQ